VRDDAAILNVKPPGACCADTGLPSVLGALTAFSGRVFGTEAPPYIGNRHVSSLPDTN
jgi:hypothetical protein